MKATINLLTYNTETADELASDSGGGYCNDFHHWEETLYRTQKGNHFLHGVGGAMSRYAEACGNNSYGGGSAIVPLTEAEALEWCEEHGCEDAIDTYFNHLTEEA
jgi:hypothetical protein